MANNRDRFGVKLSILDRITGLNPDKPRSNTVRRDSPPTIGDLRATVHRDLSVLLNTRRSDEPIPKEYAEAFSSLLTFGLPDFTGCSALDRSEQERFRREIETAIRLFEPRLADVTVSLDRPAAKDARMKPAETALRYHVRALLRVEPEPEPVYFDAVLEPGTGRVDLQTPQSRR